jgi:hypothetical protein
LKRDLVCYDINPEAIKLTESFLDFEDIELEEINECLKKHDMKKNKW